MIVNSRQYSVHLLIFCHSSVKDFPDSIYVHTSFEVVSGLTGPLNLFPREFGNFELSYRFSYRFKVKTPNIFCLYICLLLFDIGLPAVSLHFK